ncbi:MAG: ATP-binding protein, partial [Planctomycetota bacterium]
MKLLEKKPRYRLPSAEAVVSALAPFARGEETDRPSGEGRHFITAAFVGREASLSALENELAPSLGGEDPPTLCAVLGPGGVGKTRLVREFTLGMRMQGIPVAETACSPYPRASLDPLGALARPLAVETQTLEPRLKASLRALLEAKGPVEGGSDPEWARRELLESLRGLFLAGAKGSGLLLLIEDFHLASPDLVEAVLQLATEGTRFAFLFTARERFADARSEGLFRRAVNRGQVKTLSLAPFQGPDVAGWVEAALPGASMPAQTAESIARWAGGNPFLIREALLTGMAEGRFFLSPQGWRYKPPSPPEIFPPPALRTDLRLSRLSEGEREIVEALALHPGELPFEFLERFFGRKETEPGLPLLRRLARDGWIEETLRGRSFSISHERLRRPIARALGKEEKVRLHSVLAESLERRVEKDPALESAVAVHWARAGEPERAAVWCLRAGRRAHEKSMHRQAERFLRAARRFSLASGGEASQRAEIDTLLGAIFTLRGAPRKGEALLAEVAGRDLAPPLRAECLYQLAGALNTQGRTQEALSALEEASDLLENAGEPKALLTTLVGMGVLLQSLDRFSEALEVYSRLLELPRLDPPDRARILIFMGKVLFQDWRLDEAFNRTLEGLQALKGKRTTSSLAFWAYMQLGYGRLYHGRAKSALRWFRAGLKVAERFAYLPGICTGHGMIGQVAWRMGLPALACREFVREEDAYRRTGNPHPYVSSFRTTVAADTIRYPLWLASMKRRAGTGANRAGGAAKRKSYLLGWPSFYLLAGMPDKAGESLSEAYRQLDALTPQERIQAEQIEMLLALERGAADRALALALKAEGDAGSYRLNLPDHRWIKARALAALGRESEAETAFRNALETAESMGLGGKLPRIRVHRARWRLSAGDPASALTDALDAEMEAGRTARISTVWKAQYAAGLALEALGKHRRAAAFFRRAFWGMEAEALQLPSPYRDGFLSKEEPADLAKRATLCEAEKTAGRLAEFVCANLGDVRGDWIQLAVAWAGACAGLLGADAVVFQAESADASPRKGVFGNPVKGDETLTV